MTTYTWEYGSLDAGLEFTITYDDTTSEFTVTSLTGSFDLNALWFSDGNTTSDGYTLAKSDSSLNMNGPDTVWDDGTSSLQTIVWDDYGKLSSTGLGSAGENKDSFISSGETHTFSLSDFGLTAFDPTIYDTLGVRATSVNGTSAIKWVDTTPDVGNALVPGIAQVTNTPVDETLNDVSHFGTLERIVYSAPGPTGDYDVLAFTYTPPDSLSGSLTGTFSVVNNGVGDQTNPHVSGNIATYTSETGGVDEIRYFDFFTSTDQVVPTSGFAAYLSDVDQGRIVYTQVSLVGSEIGVFSTVDSTPFIIPGHTQAVNPSIGSTLVAFEDNSFGPTSEIVTYDLATNTSTRITNDSLPDRNPSVSADGNYIAFQELNASLTDSDVLVFHQISPGVFAQVDTTGLPTTGVEVNPSISGDGRFVAFQATIAGETDIYVWDRDHHTTYQFDLPGVQRNPSITEDGRHIAFESNQDGSQFDLYLADNPLHDAFAVI
jgi:hypothetical protein